MNFFGGSVEVGEMCLTVKCNGLLDLIESLC